VAPSASGPQSLKHLPNAKVHPFSLLKQGTQPLILSQEGRFSSSALMGVISELKRSENATRKKLKLVVLFLMKKLFIFIRQVAFCLLNEGVLEHLRNKIELFVCCCLYFWPLYNLLREQ
jgi:hypothetical protein